MVMEKEGGLKKSSLRSIPMGGKRVLHFSSLLLVVIFSIHSYLCVCVFSRIEEIVRDVKGAKCTEITASINKHLGDVTHTEATTEMFEQPLVVDQKVNVKAQGGWDGSSTW